MRQRERERGSVFIVALMVLVLLTAIGLSLALVTETEMLIGGNEQVINENFFAAEVGLTVAVSQLFVAHAMENKCLGMPAKEPEDVTRKVGVRTLGYSIDFTRLYPVALSDAPYTKANEGREDKLYAGFFRGSGRSLRGSWMESDTRKVPREKGELLEDIDFTVQAEKMIELAFYSAPLQAFEAGATTEATDQPMIFGCDDDPEHDVFTADSDSL